MKNTIKLVSFVMVICLLVNVSVMTIGASTVANNAAALNVIEAVPETSSYREGVALVKYDGEIDENLLSQFNLASATVLYSGSSWYTVELAADADTAETINYLRELGCFDAVDYDYIMSTTADASMADVSSNPDYGKHKHHHTHKIPEGWEHVKENGKHPGGSTDVIVAVIDTGVDYNHLDLRNNIWINPAEIPDNGMDDDGNGYVDDVYGWNCVGDNNDPMDDNGHGTHVAGIIAAENNEVGGVGIAYNCKIMVLKAGNSSGHFNNSDIAEAVQYAYMNGASVINMSFGGSSVSIAVEEALQNAYNSCVLVAAAGNDGLCNDLSCVAHYPYVGVTYPAALPYVIGVMSCNENGSNVSAFSNFDHYPFGNIEYEVYACGENIPSTWPNNKYATLSGTSMAAPMVAGIAAVLRSTYSDREVYSNKYIQSQIVNTGSKEIMTHTAVDLYEALTKIPTPSVNLYDYYIFDNEEFSDKNNGDGIIDAGETIHLAIELQNRGGVASNVVATLDTMRNDDSALTDPYFTITASSVSFSDIGTYSVRDGGKLYRENLVYDVENCFVIVVSEDCPNDYLSSFNVNINYTNGLDENDTTVYDSAKELNLSVSSGVKLPAVFTEDTTLTADKKYIVSHDVFIPEGVTVNVDPGVEIQFYENNLSYYNSVYNSPTITVSGELNFNGTADNMIKIYPSELFADCYCLITKANFIYTEVVNLGGELVQDYPGVKNGYYIADHSRFIPSTDYALYVVKTGEMQMSYGLFDMYFSKVENSYIRTSVYAGRGHHSSVYVDSVESSYFDINFGHDSYGDMYVTNFYINTAKDNVFVTKRFSTNNIANPTISIASATNNIFMTANNSISASDCATLAINDPSNTLLDAYGLYYHILIDGFYSANGDGTPLFDINDKTNVDLSKLWPFVKDVTITNADGEEVKTVGVETFNVKLEFNRPISTTADITTFFGSWYPYADYSIDGEFTSDTVWEGRYTMKAFIEDGTQYMTVSNIVAEDDGFKELVDCRGYYSFDLDTTGALSMNLQANPTNNGIELVFTQDDYDTLLGYNIYRADSKDGNYVKLNPAILLPSDETFLDENAEPGKTYWYTYTVVLTDFTESSPAGKVVATAMDTLAPNMYHTPVNQGYMNNNLVISCTASDNVAISSVALYYRTVGADSWKTLTMSKQSDKYSATIFGSELTLAGLEYYIVATDGRNTITKGSAETPYFVLIKDASAISRKGDVDGDGVVTTKDALMLIQCINGDRILSDDEFKRADLNGDETLNSSEALRILQYINGNVSTLDM